MATESEYRIKNFKVIIIGNAGVGKTSLIQRYSEGYFHDTSVHKVLKQDFIEKDVWVEGCPYRFVLWDTAGQERYRSVTRSLYHNVDGVIFVYDVTSSSSYVELKTWVLEIRDYMELTSTSCVFLANKCDLDVTDHVVTFSQLQSDPEFKVFPHKFETSALSGRNVNQAFDTLQRDIVARKGREVDEKFIEIVTKLDYANSSCSC